MATSSSPTSRLITPFSGTSDAAQTWVSAMVLRVQCCGRNAAPSVRALAAPTKSARAKVQEGRAPATFATHLTPFPAAL
jgi:hypothetical protein